MVHNLIQFIIAHQAMIKTILSGIAGTLTFLLNSAVRGYVINGLLKIRDFFIWITTPIQLPWIILKQNEKILQELYTNDGSSLRDTINRLDRRQIILNDRILGILDRDDMAIFETDNKGQFIWVNSAYLSMSGRTLTDLIGHGWINSVLETDRNRVITEWDRAIEEQRTFEMTFSFQHQYTDRITLAFVKATPNRSANEIVGWTGYISPVDN